MKGEAVEIDICGRTIKLGDFLEVEYASGRMGRIKGKVIELWSPETSGHLQARLDCGWCFHDEDKIVKHEQAL